MMTMTYSLLQLLYLTKHSLKTMLTTSQVHSLVSPRIQAGVTDAFAGDARGTEHSAGVPRGRH